MWKPMILDVECIVCHKSLQKINHNPQEASRKMGKIVQRRSRTPNWSIDEKKCLLELINERREVITRTNSGPTHFEEKDVAWNEILRVLSNRFGNKFTGSSIKKVKTQWQNMKRIAREEITLNGPELRKYSEQSLEVCKILDLVKDGVLRTESENANMNETIVSNDANASNLNETAAASNIVPIPNIEVKTERIDEDITQPSCSTKNSMDTDLKQKQSKNNPNQQDYTTHYDCSSSSSEQNSDCETLEQVRRNMKSASANTESLEDLNSLYPLHRDYQEFSRFTSSERQLKMETLKEERQVIRAMRETAELNKIIAEQRLKHILWVKKQEMAMYSGEPGSGAGRGGGGGGAIREAGGAFGKMEAAREDEYFYKKQREQLAEMKTHIDKEIAFHQEQIKRHEDAIRRHKAMADLHKD